MRIDSGRSVTPPGEWTDGRRSKFKFSPTRERHLGGSHHIVCVTEEKHGNKIFF